MVNSSHQRMKEEEGRRIAVVDAFQVVEKSNKDLKAKLAEEQKERKFIAAALENVEKQAENQRLLLHNAKDQLATSKEQVAALKKKLEEAEKAKALAKKAKDEAEKARDEAEQHRYEVRVAKTEDALRTEVPAICRTYSALTWDEALNQVGVEAFSVLRKAESVYYPPAIRSSSSAESKADPVFSEAGEIQGSLFEAPSAANTSLEGAKLAEGTIKAGDVTKEVA